MVEQLKRTALEILDKKGLPTLLTLLLLGFVLWIFNGSVGNIEANTLTLKSNMTTLQTTLDHHILDDEKAQQNQRESCISLAKLAGRDERECVK